MPAFRIVPLILATVASVACGGAKADGAGTSTSAAPATEKPSESELKSATLSRDVAAKLIAGEPFWKTGGAWGQGFLMANDTVGDYIDVGPCDSLTTKT